jgi:hypothetical protein
MGISGYFIFIYENAAATGNSEQLTQHAPHAAAAQPLDCGDVNH